MTVNVKICGINTVDALVAAEQAAASHIGLNFYPPSPRFIGPEQAQNLSSRVPHGIMRVGVFVNPDNDLLTRTLASVSLDYVQLHGSESLDRVREIKQHFDKPVIKAVPISDATDVQTAHAFEDVADFLLFDTKPPKSIAASMPGGTGLAFDWDLLTGESWSIPWFLAGGLTPENVADAVRQTGAAYVDVSSGVESEPGVKSPEKIMAFTKAAQGAS